MFYKVIQDLYPTEFLQIPPWEKTITDATQKYELEKAYRNHPFSEEFEYELNFNNVSLVDLFYSACLSSENALIKIAGNKDLRKSYFFSDVSIKEMVPFR